MSLHTVGSALVSPLSEPGREQLLECGLERLHLGRRFDDSLGVALRIDHTLDGAHCGGDLLAIFLALLDHIGLRQSEGRSAGHQRANDRHHQRLLHVVSPCLVRDRVFVAEARAKTNRNEGQFCFTTACASDLNPPLIGTV